MRLDHPAEPDRGDGVVGVVGIDHQGDAGTDHLANGARHRGVFLDYDTPKPFHVHTVLRTPHGNDYGRAWVGQWHQS